MLGWATEGATSAPISYSRRAMANGRTRQEYLDAMREQDVRLRPLDPPRACQRCQRPHPPENVGVYSHCYPCAREHGPELDFVRACTYAATGHRTWSVLRVAKFTDQTGASDKTISNCVGAVAAGVSDLLSEYWSEVLEPADEGWVAIVIPSSSALVDRAIVRMRDEGWLAPKVVRGALRADPTRPRQSTVDGVEAKRAAATGKYQADSEAVRGHHVVLIDDVYTTGYSMHDAARAIREAGASYVSGIVYARRIYPDAMAWYRTEEE
jgi:hypothetical protein